MRERGLKQTYVLVSTLKRAVAPHAGAWIETDYFLRHQAKMKSLPMRERGLKQLLGH